jgi:hypothetical protein
MMLNSQAPLNDQSTAEQDSLPQLVYVNPTARYRQYVISRRRQISGISRRPAVIRTTDTEVGYMEQPEARRSEVDVADTTRSSVESALKAAIEQDLQEVNLLPPQHSKFEHVVASVLDPEQAQRDDEALVTSVWGPEDETRVRAFAERLTRVEQSEQ